MKVNSTNQVIAKRMSLVFCGVWALLASIQVGIGFSTNGDCKVNQRMPVYLSYHGIVSLLYGIVPPLFTFFGYREFRARITIFILWGAEGVLIIYGMAEFYGTNSMLLLRSDSTCNPDTLGTSLVTEGFLFFMFLLSLVIIFVYEYTKRCRHCHRSGSRDNRVGPTRSQILVEYIRNALETRNNPQQGTSSSGPEPSMPAKSNLQQQFPVSGPEPSAPPSYEEATKN